MFLNLGHLRHQSKYSNVILLIKKWYTCPPESLDIGETAKDITGSGTFIEVIVYFTVPSVNVSPIDERSGKSDAEQMKQTEQQKVISFASSIYVPDAQSTPKTATIWPACASWISYIEWK